MQLCKALSASRFELHVDTRLVHTSSDSTDGRQTFPVELDPAFGSFSLNFTVPSTAGPGSLDLSLEVKAGGEGHANPYPQQVAWASAQVALPRPPTAVLTLAPLAEAVKAGEAAAVRVGAVSYLGAPLPGLAVRLRWSLRCGPSQLGGYGYAGAHPGPGMGKLKGAPGWLLGGTVSSAALEDENADAAGTSGCPSEQRNSTGDPRGTASRVVTRSCQGGEVVVTTGEDGTAVLNLLVSKDLLLPRPLRPRAWQSSAASASTSVSAPARIHLFECPCAHPHL